MRISPRFLLLLLYMFGFIYLFAEVLSGMPINNVTVPWVILLAVVFVIGLIFIMAWDYLIPQIFRSYTIGNCKVIQKKYILCRYKSSPELTGRVMLKVIPSQTISDMDRDRRMSYLDSVQGLLAGSHFEVEVSYIGVRDRYHETIKDRLQAEKQRLQSLAFKESLSVREALDRINRELAMLDHVPIILEGFYIASAKEYGMDEEDLVKKLESDARALSAMLEKLGTKVYTIEGEELRDILLWSTVGSVFQTGL